MSFSRTLLSLAVAALALGQFASPANAGLLGQTLGAGYYLPDTATVYPDAVFTPPSFVVGAGQETDGNVEDVTHLLVDFDDTTLDITLTTVLSNPTWLNQAFNGLIFTATAPHGITGATVGGSTTMAGFDDSRVTLTGDQILVNWGGLGYVDGTTVSIQFTFIPEPGTALLLGGGLFVLGFARRAKRMAS